MRKILVIVFVIFLTNLNWIYAQDFLFLNLYEHLNVEYEELVKANEKGNWLSEKDLERIKNLKDYDYRSNAIFYEGLADKGRPNCDEMFELVFFTFYRYEFPAYPWCDVVYKHKYLDIYVYVSFDILDHTGNGFGGIIRYRHFEEFMEEYKFDYGFDEHYWNYLNELNFSGFAAWFESEEITRVRFLHDSRDFKNLMHAASRIR